MLRIVSRNALISEKLQVSQILMLISGQVSYLDTDLGFGVREKDLEGKDKKANVQGGVLDLQKNRRVWLENGVRDPFYKLG